MGQDSSVPPATCGPQDRGLQDCGVQDFPPAGWVTNQEAAQLLSVSRESILMRNWKWHAMLRAGAKTVRRPGGGRCNIYAREAIERIIAARDAARRAAPPEGFVDKQGACQFFGITPHVWKNWINQGKVRCGVVVPAYTGARRTVYRLEDLQRLKDELFGEDKLYKGADQQWHVPAGYIGREEAWEHFGVQKATWERWEREEKIVCGERVPGGPKLYKIEDIERMLDEYGKWATPYPDPDRPGVYRVPLSGRDIRRREALIDADALALIEGGTCHWSQTGHGHVAFWGAGGEHVPLRRLVLGITSAHQNVGHVNRDPLDCRRENLVVRTPKQRSYTQRKRTMVAGRRTTSRFKGVYWNWQIKRWCARIRWQDKTRSLGNFHDEIAAAQAYDEAARQWFGEHAWLNFPDGIDTWRPAGSSPADSSPADSNSAQADEAEASAEKAKAAA